MNDSIKQVIVVRKDLGMRSGKIASQVAHAAMKFIIENNESSRDDALEVMLSPNEAIWLSESFTKIILGVQSEWQLQNLIFQAKLNDIQVYEIIDEGRTEFNGVPTLTCAAFGPDESDVLDKITGGLKLF